MKILGLDYGEKRIGIAISDELGLLAHPLKVIDNKDQDMLIDILKENSIERVVIGKPLNLDGTHSKKTEETLGFVELFKKKTDVPVITWDERFSTKEAQRNLVGFDVSRKKRKKVIDKMAAQIILQGYLDSIRTMKDV